MLCYTFLSLLKRLSTEVGLTCVAQKRLCLSSLICVQRKTWGRKQANASKTWKNDDGRKRQMCREISTRSGRRFTSFLFPSRGPLHFVTTTRLCPRAQYKKRSIWGGGGPLPISFPPPPLSAPDTQAKSTKHDMKPHPNNALPTFKAECRT